MRRTYLFGGLACCVLAAVWSCGLDDTAVVAIDQADGSTNDGSAFDGSSNDAASDTGVADTGANDTGIPDAGPCPATDLTTCDNGICTSGTEVCAPTVGAGWTVVNLISGSRPACVAGYAPRDIVEIADGGAAACACSCAHGGDPTCDNATVNLGTGGGACTGSISGYPMTGGCHGALSLNITATPYEATVQATTACGGLLDASIPNPDAGLGRECDLQPDAGSTVLCENHRSCVPKPATGHICVAHAAPATCPTGFTVSYQSSVADGFSDSRSCPACTCAWNNDGCNSPVVTLHTTTDCSAGGDVPGNVSTSACQNVTGVYASLGVTGTPSVAAPVCGVTDGGVVDGGVAITNDEVVCCSN